MMTTSAKYILAAMAVIAATGLRAQELQQEIEVERSVEVEHHDASRVIQKPQIELPKVTVKPLAFSDRTVNVAIPNAITMLEPTAYADTIETSPYNGYATLGYLPVYNLAASAGYRIIDNDHSRLNAWLQFDGRSYKDSRTVNPATDNPFDRLIHRNTFTIGANYHLMVGKESELDAGADYTYAHFNVYNPTGENPAFMHQGINRLNTSLQWMSKIQSMAYTAGIDYTHFGYVKGFDFGDPEQKGNPVRENYFRFNGAASMPFGDASQVYLGADLDVLSNTRRSFIEDPMNGDFNYNLVAADGAYTHALLSIKPRYRLKTSNLQLTVGALVQFTFKSGKVFHIAPDVSVSWSPIGMLTIWGKAGGGEHQNTLASLYDVNYMTAPMMAYKNSHIPIIVDGGITVGPVRGFSAELYGGFGVANDWLMPICPPDNKFGLTMFDAVNLKGGHLGLALSYKYRSLIEGRLSGELAPQSYDKGYYLWRDRAKYVMKVEVKAHPMVKLDVGATYELRACRAIIDRCINLEEGNTYFAYNTHRLGNISNLGINGAYHLSKQLTVFLTLENLLNHRPETLGLVEAQGITGLAGVSYKF